MWDIIRLLIRHYQVCSIAKLPDVVSCGTPISNFALYCEITAMARACFHESKLDLNKTWKISSGLSLILPCLVVHHHCHQHPRHSLKQHVRPSGLLFPTSFGLWLAPHKAEPCPDPGAPGQTGANTWSFTKMAHGDEFNDLILQTWVLEFFGREFAIFRGFVVHAQKW